jgi:hypothetical protein
MAAMAMVFPDVGRVVYGIADFEPTADYLGRPEAPRA